MSNPFDEVLRTLGCGRKYFSLLDLDGERLKQKPYCIRILLESAVRNCDGLRVTKEDVERLLNWKDSAAAEKEVAFLPARVLLQDLTGVPAVVDLAVMREAVSSVSDRSLDPLCQTDLVIDHSVVVDSAGDPSSLSMNESLEFERNKERFSFLKWSQGAFNHMKVVPPGSGIVHQVNLELLAPVVYEKNGFLYPDTVFGTDSHTTMINGLGVLGWGVGGIEAEATMLGQPSYLVVPEVLGFKLSGQLKEMVTTTDLVLKIAQMMRRRGVVGKIIEFFGPGVDTLSVADRATISNMSPEFGATSAFFPCDLKTLRYLESSGRTQDHVDKISNYLTANNLLRTAETEEFLVWSGEPIQLDMCAVEPALAGPKRPHDLILLAELHKEFPKWLSAPVGFRGYGLASPKADGYLSLGGNEYACNHGMVVIAAITSCTNTSNPEVMIWAGLLCKRAAELGLKPPAYVKCSLSPGSHVVHEYLKNSKLLAEMESLGFYETGFGCQTCIGNSGDIEKEIADYILKEDLVAVAVLSGNRNFEGRIHPLTRANFLASPPLVIAYALAGYINIDFETQPISSKTLEPIFLRDIWPTREEVQKYIDQYVTPALFNEVYSNILEGNENWKTLSSEPSKLYQWDENSTYIHRPPYFDDFKLDIPKDKSIRNIENAMCLLNLGDSITTDHISPAGKIALDSPASQYLQSKGVAPREFNTYGTRRGNDLVMIRGTFANGRLVNKLASKIGPYTVHVPTGEEIFIYDAAIKYKEAKIPTIILAGKEYGSGSSRDWAAKGSKLLGVKAVIAQSYERIHRSNLVGMGVLPLQFVDGESAESLNVSGHELFNLDLSKLGVHGTVKIAATNVNGKVILFQCKARIDTAIELEYYKQDGIMPYVVRKIALGQM